MEYVQLSIATEKATREREREREDTVSVILTHVRTSSPSAVPSFYPVMHAVLDRKVAMLDYCLSQRDTAEPGHSVPLPEASDHHVCAW